jgi:hypothetical protein
LLNEVIDHCKHSWTNVTHGKGTLEENLEVGAEVVAGTAAVVFAAKFGLGKLFPAAEKILPESSRALPEAERGLAPAALRVGAERTRPIEGTVVDFGESDHFIPEVEAARARIATQVEKQIPFISRVELANATETDAHRLAILAHDSSPHVKLSVIRNQTHLTEHLSILCKMVLNRASSETRRLLPPGCAN